MQFFQPSEISHIDFCSQEKHPQFLRSDTLFATLSFKGIAPISQSTDSKANTGTAFKLHDISVQSSSANFYWAKLYPLVLQDVSEGLKSISSTSPPSSASAVISVTACVDPSCKAAHDTNSKRTHWHHKRPVLTPKLAFTLLDHSNN